MAKQFKMIVGAAWLAGMLAMPGCKGKDGAPLYVYDGGTNSVLAWDDVDTIHADQIAGTTVPDADRIITSTLLTSLTPPLAWGGLAVDSNTNMLYLVTQDGVVTRISSANTRSGALTETSEIVQFYLGSASTDRFSSGSVFGQASVDPTNNVLYVMETSTDGTGARVWSLPSASEITSGYSFSPATSYTDGVANDTWGSGLTAGTSSRVFALFGGGTSITDPRTDANVGGPRLREGQRGTTGLFPTSSLDLNLGINVIFGDSTGLTGTTDYGSLAFDGANNAVYVFAQPASTFATTVTATAVIQVFDQGLFGTGGNQAPSRTLTDVPSDLRIIAHPLNSDWLLGATYTPDSTTAPGLLGTGAATLLIWKDPSGGGTATAVTLPGVTSILGMAVGSD